VDEKQNVLNSEKEHQPFRKINDTSNQTATLSEAEAHEYGTFRMHFRLCLISTTALAMIATYAILLIFAEEHPKNIHNAMVSSVMKAVMSFSTPTSSATF
ncbi:hypothetical protein JTB14_021431, partial [Gonioctena quinquepunctata]